MTAETRDLSEDRVRRIVHRYAGTIREQAAEETTRRNAATLQLAGYHAAAEHLRKQR